MREEGSGATPPGAEGLDRALDVEETERVPRAHSGSEKPNPGRSLGDWGALLGKALTVLVIAAGTAWNGVSAHYAEQAQAKRTEAQAQSAAMAQVVKDAKARKQEQTSDEGYKLLARTVNVHTDQLERLKDATAGIEELADYIEWKYNQDVQRYGPARMERMISRFVAVEGEPDDRLSQEELIARIVSEMAKRQAEKRGKRVQLPKKASHIPEEREFFK